MNFTPLPVAEDPPFPSPTPLSLGDMFDRTFTLTGKVFLRSLIICLFLFVPVTLLLGESAREFYGIVGENMQKEAAAQEQDPAGALDLLRAVAFFGLSLLLIALASLAGEIAVTLLVKSELSSAPMTWKSAMGGAMGVRLVRALGVVLGEGAAGFGLMLVAGVLAAVSGGGPIAIVLGLLAALGLMVFLVIRWSMAFTVVACEDEAAMRAFRRSWSLTRGQWCRALGILLLMGFLMNFAVALVTAPVSLAAFWEFYREYFRAVSSAVATQSDRILMGQAMSSMGFGLGLSLGVQLMLFTILRPVYTIVLYTDLRARKPDAHDVTPGLSNASVGSWN